MDYPTVASLAASLNRPPESLLALLREAGLRHVAPADRITEDDKSALLAYLKRLHSVAEDVSTSTPPMIQVVVRRKRTTASASSVAATKRAATTSASETPPLLVSHHEYKIIRRSGAVVSFDPDLVAPALKPLFAGMPARSVLGGWVDVVFGALVRRGSTQADAFLRKLLARQQGAAKRKALVALVDTTAAEDRWSCLLAACNARVHPAFAPPGAAV